VVVPVQDGEVPKTALAAAAAPRARSHVFVGFLRTYCQCVHLPGRLPCFISIRHPECRPRSYLESHYSRSLQSWTSHEDGQRFSRDRAITEYDIIYIPRRVITFLRHSVFGVPTLRPEVPQRPQRSYGTKFRRLAVIEPNNVLESSQCIQTQIEEIPRSFYLQGFTSKKAARSGGEYSFLRISIYGQDMSFKNTYSLGSAPVFSVSPIRA
jgi:hypothetical protein